MVDRVLNMPLINQAKRFLGFIKILERNLKEAHVRIAAAFHMQF